MSLFIKKTEPNTLPALGEVQAMEIYEALKTKDPNRLFLEDNIPTEYSMQVLKEISKLEGEMVSKMNGTFVTLVGSPAVPDEEGEFTTSAVPPTYFIVSTEANLVSSMDSSILTVATVVEDVRIWSDGSPSEEPSWEVYKNSFSNGE